MNKKQTGSALISSVVALVLCFAMLLGATFAWFTDTASTSVNKIQAGTLKVDIVDKDGNSLQGKTLSFKKAEGHENEEILWEPGCTYELEEFYIKNNGNLALKYTVVVTGITGDSKLNEAIEWTYELGDANAILIPGDSDESKSGAITIKGHMKETAGNEYQGLSIDGVAVTVSATQAPYEYDSSNNTYDANATYFFSKAVGGDQVVNGTYVAAADSAVGNSTTAFYVNGYDEATNVTITGGYFDGGNGAAGSNALWVAGSNANVTIKDGYFTVGADKDGKGNSVIYAQDGAQVTIEGGTFYTEYAFGSGEVYYVLNCADGTGAHITVKGGKFYKFNPANASTKGSDSYVGKDEVSVAEGFKVVNDGDWYYVVPENATYVSTADDLTAAVKNGGVVVLESDVTLTDVIKIDKDVTIYGNGNTITAASGKDRIFDCAGNDNDISIKLYKLTMDAPKAERGISLAQNKGKVYLEIDSCTVTADHYAVNVAMGNTDVEVNVKYSTLTGYCAAQTWSENSKLTFNNCTLNGVNKWDGEGNDFSTVVINDVATNATVILNNCSVNNYENGTANQYFFNIRTNATITATGCTFTENGTTVAASNVTNDCDICNEGTLTIN